MTARSIRKLLVLSDPAPWVPEENCAIGSCSLQISRAGSLEELRSTASDSSWDVVAFRVESLRPLSPTEALSALREVAPRATFLPITRLPDPRDALTYLKRGAFEYLEEPLAPEEFLRALGEAIENRDAYVEILNLNQTLEEQKQQLLIEKQDLERKNRELQAVSRLARALASTLDLDEILTQLVGCIHETLGCKRIVIGLLDPTRRKETARIGLSAGKRMAPEELERMTWPVREVRRHPWIRTVLHEGRELRVDGPSIHPETQGTPIAEIHPQGFVKLPLRSRGQIIGSITAEGKSSEGHDSDQEISILRIFADTAALAIENARLYQTMRELSVRDELTGLYNRRHLLRQLDAEWNHAHRHSSSLALLMLDLDHFKRLNDDNDHLTGDAALRKVAAAFLRNTRGIDTVARYGGEEFVVLLPRADRKNALIVGEKLRRVIEKTGVEGDIAVPPGALTVSVGVAAYPEDSANPKELLERADWALYRAKAEGRNRVCVWLGEDRLHAN